MTHSLKKNFPLLLQDFTENLDDHYEYLAADTHHEVGGTHIVTL